MAISFVGEASAIDTSVVLPAHQTGDLIVIFAYRSSSAIAPTIPAGFTTINSGAGNTNGHAAAYKIAASSSEVSGTWTNAELIIAEVYRGATGVGAQAQITNVTEILIPALTLTVTNGSSWVGAFAGCRIGTQPIETPPPGMVLRTDIMDASIREAVAFDTNSGVSSWTQQTGGSTGGSRFRALSYEIVAAAASGITATLNVTEQNETVASAGTLKITATLTSVEQSETLSSSGQLLISASANITDADETLSSAGQLQISGTLNVTEQNETVSASGTIGNNAITGSLNITEQNDTVSSTAKLEIRGTLNVTEQNETVSATGELKVNINGVLNVIDDSDTLFAVGVLDIVPTVTPVDRIYKVVTQLRIHFVSTENRVYNVS